jgi:hypothetical protein
MLNMKPAPAETVKTARQGLLETINAQLELLDQRTKQGLEQAHQLQAGPQLDEKIYELQQLLLQYATQTWQAQELVGLLSGEIPDYSSKGWYFSLSRQRWALVRMIGEQLLVESLTEAGQGQLELTDTFLFNFDDWRPIEERHYQHVLDKHLDTTPALSWTIINL